MGVMEKINNEVLKMESINWKELKPFQGNLKDLSVENYEKLKISILKNGLSFAKHVWKDEKGIINILDGHQTVRCLEKMEQEGYSVPLIPCVFVNADSYKQAKEKLLAITSQYGTITDQGLYEYLAESGINWRDAVESFTFDSIDFNDFAMNFYGEVQAGIEKEISNTSAEISLDDFNNLDHECPKCGFTFSDKK